MLALLLGALASGVAFSHLLEIPGKRRMPTEYAVAVQQLLYVGYRAPAAVIELGAMLSALVAIVLVWGEGGEFWLTVVALAALVGTMVVFVLVTERQNRRILSWHADAVPADWTRIRARWEASHGARAGLFLAAVGLLAAALHES
jgi:uncharacterized membrane protein